MIKIALSFDDGRKDNYIMAKEILEPLNIPATFNITIGYIEKVNNIEKPSEHEPMSIEELIELSRNNLFEIAGHGYEHNNDKDNLIKGVIELRKILNYNDNQKMGIVSPKSQFNTSQIKEMIEDFKNNNIVYLRIGKRFEKYVFFKKVIRKINRKLNLPFIYSLIYKDSNIKKDDNFILYTAGIIRDNKLKEVKRLILDAIKEDKSYILTMHSILKPNEEFYNDLFTWDYDEFIELCKFLKELENNNQIKICKVIEMINN